MLKQAAALRIVCLNRAADCVHLGSVPAPTINGFAQSFTIVALSLSSAHMSGQLSSWPAFRLGSPCLIEIRLHIPCYPNAPLLATWCHKVLAIECWHQCRGMLGHHFGRSAVLSGVDMCVGDVP